MALPLPRLIPLTLAAGALIACSDFDTPAQLPHPQILAVVADPPIVARGERAELTVLVAGPDGAMSPAIAWAAPVVVDGDGRAWFEAPVDASDGFVVVRAQAALADGTTLAADKSVGIASAGAANPTIAAVRIDGDAIGDQTTLHRDWLVELTADIAPPPTADALFSWYASVGELAFYRRTPAELATSDRPHAGDLFLVYRDGYGGTTWRHIAVTVD